MLRFLLRRLVLAALVIITVLTVSFALTHVAGDLATAIAGPNATAADVEAVRKAYGLDRPILVQFAEWAARAARGDFGDSFFSNDKVSTLIAHRLPVTATLGFVGIAIALAVALPLGIIAAVRQNTVVDRLVSLIAVIGQAMPTFWFGLILMVVFGLRLGWLPVSGTGSWQHFIMPGVVLAFTGIPALLRLTRSGMIEVLASDYIRTARAKGLRERTVVLHHALENAAIPIVSIAAVQLGFMLGGSVVIEQVFALHGVGYLAWESISKNDFPVVQAVVLVLSCIYVLLTLIADLANAFLDPRLRTA
jgi:peptide/nickel transport system permease protein